MNFENGHDGESCLVRIPPHVQEDHELLNQYRRLAARLCDLQHPHIVRVQEVLSDNYLLIENLQSAQALCEPPQVPEELMRGLFEALEYAHWRGLPHRLLSCGSLWLFPGNTLKVWGFGVDYLDLRHGPAQMFDVPETACYWSPEHCRHEEPDVRSDIWSLGIILYRWFAGRLPFQSNCLPVLVDRIVSYHPPAPPGPYADLILRCLEKKPEDRFQNLGEVGRYL